MGDPDRAEVICPICSGTVTLPVDVIPNQLVECPECESELEVVGLEPVDLQEAPEFREDWGE